VAGTADGTGTAGRLTGPRSPLETTDAELRDLAEALRHCRDNLWRGIWRQRCDALLDRRNTLTRS